MDRQPGTASLLCGRASKYIALTILAIGVAVGIAYLVIGRGDAGGGQDALVLVTIGLAIGYFVLLAAAVVGVVLGLIGSATPAGRLGLGLNSVVAVLLLVGPWIVAYWPR